MFSSWADFLAPVLLRSQADVYSPRSSCGTVFARMTSSDPMLAASERFYDGALERIRKFLIACAAIGLLLCLIRFRWAITCGFLLGAAISYVNHRWLAGMVNALGERITTGKSHERGGVLVFRAMLRYGFIAVGAYVIFKGYPAALYGFLGGICLPILAVGCEVALELFTALRRGL
jgi:hypothetical protein